MLQRETVPKRCAAVWSFRPREPAHERTTHGELARRLAALQGLSFAGPFAPHATPRPCYLVPSDTLVGATQAGEVGVAAECDLFGGIVPEAFVATKAITHPLLHADAEAPPGWNPAFADSLRGDTLTGLTAFNHVDGRAAGLRLLADGPVRIKPVRATAGRGQVVVRDARALEAALAELDAHDLAQCGVVLEEDLTDVTTYSVGQVRVGSLVASYYGTQRITTDNTGARVYGGSTLRVARGGYEALAMLALPADARVAVRQAQAYDAAADRCFAGLVASRRNYDTAVGRNARGRRRSGVLEQSWRIGGASGAEVAALEAFTADPRLNVVQAATVELYGASPRPPAGAQILFQGEDNEVGPITKCVVTQAYDHP